MSSTENIQADNNSTSTSTCPDMSQNTRRILFLILLGASFVFLILSWGVFFGFGSIAVLLIFIAFNTITAVSARLFQENPTVQLSKIKANTFYTISFIVFVINLVFIFIMQLFYFYSLMIICISLHTAGVIIYLLPVFPSLGSGISSSSQTSDGEYNKV